MQLSIVVPIHNEEPSILPLYDRLTLVLDAEGLSYPLTVDPSWSTISSVATARSQHTATLLPSGKVLVAGGDASA